MKEKENVSSLYDNVSEGNTFSKWATGYVHIKVGTTATDLITARKKRRKSENALQVKTE